MNKFIEKNKKLIILCLIVLGIYMASLFFDRNTDLFCSADNSAVGYNCWSEIENGFTGPIQNIFPYLSFSLLILFFVSDRLKRNTIIAMAIISILVLPFIFLAPVDCGSLFCSRIDNSLLSRPIYPIVTILTLLISAIFFYFKDKRAVKKL